MDILALAWIGIIGFGIIMYVLLDGFDLGIGIITPLLETEQDRSIIVSAILPVWDGNETWLVFGGAALYGAFPLAFSTILPMLYLPILVMVVALLLRGVAFEFRLKSHSGKKIWDWCFFTGSILAAFIQGVILGSFVQGYPTIDLHHAESMYQWLSPFTITCGVALIFGYLLLGADRLIAKTTGHIQARCIAVSTVAQYIILGFAIVVSLWSPFLDPAIRSVWFNPSYMPYLAIFPLLTIVCFVLHVQGLRKKHDHTPFWSLIGMFLLCYIGFIISSYPYIVPRHITFTQAAAPHSTLLFMLIGACVMLPILLFYTYQSYRIFSGKITESLEY